MCYTIIYVWHPIRVFNKLCRYTNTWLSKLTWFGCAFRNVWFCYIEENVSIYITELYLYCIFFLYMLKVLSLSGRIKFFQSENNVILSPGNADGAIPPRFFSRVELNEGGRSRSHSYLYCNSQVFAGVLISATFLDFLAFS